MRKILLAVAIAAVASMAVVSAASADVPRTQGQTQTVTTTTKTTATFTVTQPAGQVGQWDNVWTHNYTVTVNPDGTFTGTGHMFGQDQNGPYEADETISGTLANDMVTLTATRTTDGLTYTLVNAPFGDTVTIATLNVVVPWLIEMKVTNPVITTTSSSETTTTSTDYKNHGDYVSSMGGGADAAHSPIGKPIKASK
jgi:hypothetical protein